MQLAVKLFLLVSVAYMGNCASIKATPFSNLKRYSVSGIIQLPYAEVNEPFRAWYDSDQFASRIDYYDGILNILYDSFVIARFKIRLMLRYGEHYSIGTDHVEWLRNGH